MRPDTPVENLIGRAEALAHPSLALIKYWGKSDVGRNLPAVPSLALTLDGLNTRTVVEIRRPDHHPTAHDHVEINGAVQEPNRFVPFFTEFRRICRERSSLPEEFVVHAVSHSDFPTSAGLASSASGFAALATAAAAAASLNADGRLLSSLARIGSASAARSIWGGFTRLDAHAESAEPVHGEDWWPELRVIVLQLESGAKPISSREAMERTRRNSPFYPAWVAGAPELMNGALEALNRRDLSALGSLTRLSTMRMFATMLSADPPVVYWKPGTLAAIGALEKLRARGVGVWETMDAGPQVKMFTLESDVDEVTGEIGRILPDAPLRICRPGGPSTLL